jgi:hypothetical protein
MDEFFNHIIFQNFMDSSIENRILLNNGSVFTETGLSVVGVDSFINFYNKVYFDTCLSEESSPHFVCTGCGSLKELEELVCSSEEQKMFNSRGLSIYLFEDVYISTGPKIKNYLEGPPLQGDTTEYYKRYGPTIRGFELTPENYEHLYCFELESIKTFVDNNKLNKVTVYCGDYNAAKYLQDRYPTVTIVTRNLYVISSAKRILENSKDEITTNIPNQITHKFLSANGKYKAVRHLTAAYLLDKNSIISFDQTKSIWGSLQNQLWFKLASWNKSNLKMFNRLMQNLQKLETMPSLIIGNNPTIPNPNFSSDFDFAPQTEYERCFCAVVCETKYSHPVATFSEKTLNAIHRHRPFILVAPPHTLEYLKLYGFKTFSSYWDESYDSEENHEKRLIKIFKTIDYINNLPITSLRNLYQTLTPILDHNYQVIKNIPKSWST